MQENILLRFQPNETRLLGNVIVDMAYQSQSRVTSLGAYLEFSLKQAVALYCSEVRFNALAL